MSERFIRCLQKVIYFSTPYYEYAVLFLSQVYLYRSRKRFEIATSGPLSKKLG